eukprot:6285415-Amphidinium_carterae.2
MPAAGETFHPRLAVCSAGLTNFHRIHGERERGRNPLEQFCRDERQKHRRLHESHSLYTYATEDVLRRVKNFRESFGKPRVFHVDVRDLFNLAQDRNLCGHVGLHLQNVRTIGQHPKLDELLTAYGRIVWDALDYFRESAEADGSRTLTKVRPAEADLAKLKEPLLLIFWCKSGRHRSVAMADFCAWHLSHMLKLPTDLIHLCNSAWPRGCDDCALTCSRHGRVLEQRQELYSTIWLPRLLQIHRPFGEGIETPRRARLQQDFPFAQRRCGGVHVAFEDDVEEVHEPVREPHLPNGAVPDPGRTRLGMSTDARYQNPGRDSANTQQWSAADSWTDRWGGWSDSQWQWDEHRWHDDHHRWHRPTPTGRSRSPPARMPAGRSRSPPARMRPRSRSRVPPSPHPTDCEDDPTDDDEEYVQEVQQQQACERDDAFFPRRKPYIPPQRVLDGRRPVFKPRGQSSAVAEQTSAASDGAAVAAPRWQQMPRISILGINLGGKRRRTDLREFISNSAMHICLCLELIQATDAAFFEERGIGFVGEMAAA